MDLRKLLESFNRLHWSLRMLLSLGLVLAFIVVVSHRDFIESITHVLQAFPVIIVLRSGSLPQRDQSNMPSSPPLQTQQSHSNSIEP
jgi:hypothetical protein